MTKLKLALLLIPSLLIPSLSAAGHLFPEAHYQRIWCEAAGGRMEVVTNGIRIDCLDSERATEHDFSSKYREGLIQAIEYAMYTGKRATLVLISERSGDARYVQRARLVRDFYKLPIDIEVMGP